MNSLYNKLRFHQCIIIPSLVIITVFNTNFYKVLNLKTENIEHTIAYRTYLHLQVEMDIA